MPGPVLEDAAVVIQDGRVGEVRPAASLPAGLEVLDLGDAVILPGLIDAHVHLALDPAGGKVTTGLDASDDDIAAHMIANARALLAAGVTTARDLGAPTAAAIAVRAALAAGGGLRLLVAGAPITGVGAHLHFFGGAAATVEDAVELVRRQVRAGVDWIKLVLTGGEITPGSHLRAQALAEPAARAATAAAHRLGRRVAAHAHTAEAARLAVAVGVDTVEHCTLLDADPGTVIAPDVVCPTANGRWLAAPEASARVRAGRLAALQAAGSTLIAGTDAGIPGVAFGAYADGLLALHGAGLRAEAVMGAATSAAAAALGLSDRGTLDPGRLGDLVAFDADPLAGAFSDHATMLRHPRAVIVAGCRVCM
ncbi:amidohydrolase family protein [Jatrophihabitans cynanchi]|uniref:Amidohydrolase family protein n=1 Tax=Jatrophihabitans cynanchi TaxID=2944128 RepID=A0ABY7K2N9_9ACTN|nr:amidohydrolase family protein [Jatrophihabitans sp. SB3-54]WAX58969.1 amidohydrolase family protein [Jatrophihabitans sp. SB3-54]